MEQLDTDVPLPPAPVVAVIYNLKHKDGIPTEIPDAEAEYDSIETVYAIQNSLVKQGYRVTSLEADDQFPQKLMEAHVGFAFNIAEGRSGRAREAQVPALLDMLGIPYTGSDATTLCIALDKALTKRVLATYHVKTPPYILLRPDGKVKSHSIPYPVIVKPNAEGSSKGIADISVAKTPEALKELAERNHRLYREDMLAESFVGGREFTVGLLGNGEGVKVFPPMEIVYTSPVPGDYPVYNYTVKQDYTRYVRYECPARLTSEVEKKIIRTAKKVFLSLGCRDFARVDFRLSEDEKELFFIEVNPLPGLAPGYSDFPMLAEFCGMGYDALTGGILHAAFTRCGVDPAPFMMRA